MPSGRPNHTFMRATSLAVVVRCFALLAVLLVAGCTTTTSSKTTVDLEKAEEAHLQAGLGYLRQGDKDPARRHFQRALKINSHSAGAHNGLALVYQLERDWDRAEKHFREALALDSDFALARNNYGAFLYRQQRYDEAETELTRVSQNYDYDHRFIALLNLGRTQIRLGKIDAAVKSLRQSLAINSRTAQAHLELAGIFFERHELQAARFHLEQYGQHSRHSARSLWLGIRIESLLGNKDKAASYALALRNLHPESAEYREFQRTLQ